MTWAAAVLERCEDAHLDQMECTRVQTINIQVFETVNAGQEYYYSVYGQKTMVPS